MLISKEKPVMGQNEAGFNAGQKGAWTTPRLLFDGELGEIVQATRKPTFISGEGGDPGSRPSSD
jgi:hypothetical protein